MTFYIGQKKAGEIFLGDKKIGRVYLGQKLVHMTVVVGNPTFLEYVIFDGASWIDTGYKPNNNTKVVGSVIYHAWHSGTAHYTFGVWGNNQAYGLTPGSAGSHQLFYMVWGSQSIGSTVKPVLEQKYDFETSKNGVIINGITGIPASNLTETFQSEKTMYVGWANGTSNAPSKQTIYSMQIYENDVLQMDLRPALDPSGVVCFYDTVTKKYFYNQGTGELKAGGRFVESIVFDGASYIDTLFKPNPRTTRTVLDCMLLDDTSAGGQGVFGARPTPTGSINSVNIWFNTADSQKCFRFDCTGNTQVRSNIIDITQRLNIDCLDKNATVNGVTYSSVVNKSNTTYLAYSMYLGNFNNAGNPYTKGCKMNCYRFAIYDDGTLAHDFRPYVDGDGVACFKDVVTDTLFYNKGTGTLTYTE